MRIDDFTLYSRFLAARLFSEVVGIISEKLQRLANKLPFNAIEQSQSCRLIEEDTVKALSE